MKPTYPSVRQQQVALVAWLEHFAEPKRRQSAAVMEVTGWSAHKRRRMFRELAELGCIAFTPGVWTARKRLPTTPQG